MYFLYSLILLQHHVFQMGNHNANHLVRCPKHYHVLHQFFHKYLSPLKFALKPNLNLVRLRRVSNRSSKTVKLFFSCISTQLTKLKFFQKRGNPLCNWYEKYLKYLGINQNTNNYGCLNITITSLHNLLIFVLLIFLYLLGKYYFQKFIIWTYKFR